MSLSSVRPCLLSSPEKKPEPLRLRVFIQETLMLLRASIPSSVEIRQFLEADDSVLADPTQMHQVVVNLCTNAVQAMDGRGRMEIRLFRREARHGGPCLRPGSYLVLQISDSGKGMEERVKERLFEPFFTTKAEGQGTGLGLAVAHGIVAEHHGGEPARPGDHFSVYLPLSV